MNIFFSINIEFIFVFFIFIYQEKLDIFQFLLPICPSFISTIISVKKYQGDNFKEKLRHLIKGKNKLDFLFEVNRLLKDHVIQFEDDTFLYDKLYEKDDKKEIILLSEINTIVSQNLDILVLKEIIQGLKSEWIFKFYHSMLPYNLRRFIKYCHILESMKTTKNYRKANKTNPNDISLFIYSHLGSLIKKHIK